MCKNGVAAAHQTCAYDSLPLCTQATKEQHTQVQCWAMCQYAFDWLHVKQLPYYFGSAIDKA